MENPNPQPPMTAQQELLALMRRQNELLESILHNQQIAPAQGAPALGATDTRVVDFRMSIGAMIAFMFKWIIASIPVAILLAVLGALLTALLAALGVGLWNYFPR